RPARAQEGAHGSVEADAGGINVLAPGTVPRSAARSRGPGPLSRGIGASGPGYLSPGARAHGWTAWDGSQISGSGSQHAGAQGEAAEGERSASRGEGEE